MQLKINDIKINLVLILIGVCPIFFLSDNLNPLEVIRHQRTAFFIITALLIIASCHVNKYIGAFLLLSVVHMLMFDSLTFFDSKMRFLLLGALVYHFVCKNYTGKAYKWVLLFVTFATVSIAVLQYFHKDIFFYAKMETPGMMILPSYMGQFCALVAPSIALIHPALLIIPIIGLMLSKSIISIIAFSAAMLFMLYFKSKKVFNFMVILVILALTLLAQRDFDSGQWGRRFEVWKMVSSRAFRSPFIGHGIGNYNKTLFMEWSYRDQSRWFSVELKDNNIEPLNNKIREIAEEGGFDTSRLDLHNNLKHKMDEMRGKGLNSYVWDHPHNEYLLVWYEYGLLGFFIIILFIVDIFRRFHGGGMFSPVAYYWIWDWDDEKQIICLMASFIAVLILCMAHFTLYLPVTAPVAIVLVAMLDRKLEE